MVRDLSSRAGSRRATGFAALTIAALVAAGTTGCGMLPSRGEGAPEEARPGPGTSEDRAAVQSPEAGRFEEPGELDRLADARPIPLPPVKTAASAAAAPAKTPAEAAAKGRFRIQVGAENDFDAAQEKKREYERKLGGTVDVVFDAPYYKLRWGYFETRQDAEDKILEIGEFNIQGFVIKH